MLRADQFYFDPARTPERLRSAVAQRAFVETVTRELVNNLRIEPAVREVAIPAVIGLLLLDERYDPDAFGFAAAIHKLYLNELLAQSRRYQAGPRDPLVTNLEVYLAIDEQLEAERGGKGEIVSFQEFASVGRFVTSRLDQIPLGHPNFPTQVKLGVESYVSGDVGFDSLDLPPLTGDDGADVEVLPDNVKAFGTVLASYYLEQLRLFDVVDRLSETFTNGLLAVGLDEGGRLLDTYFWSSDDRMTKAARMMHFSRMLGAAGGEVSREVQPNREFQALWARFLASVSEFDRQDRVADLLNPGGRRPVSQTGENVRKAGRDLAANATLYAYGSAHFAARRLRQQVTESLDILKSPSILKAVGVSTPWQVIERVAAQDFGVSPNIVRYRTLADTGKQILDLIANNAAAWTSTAPIPLFADPAAPAGPVGLLGGRAVASQISFEDRQKLVRLVEQAQAVTGIKDQQIADLSQPEDTLVAPSIPSFGAPTKNGSGNALDQLRQLVSSGQTPSLDQLRSLLPS